MAFTFEETPESRDQQYDNSANNSVTRIYKSVGEQDDSVITAYIAANVASSITTFVGTLFFKALRMRPDGFKQYYVEIDYAPPTPSNIPRGSYTFNFDTTGGTVNVKCGKSHIHSYHATGSGPTNPHKGAIGVTADGIASGVQGADIIVPALKFSLAFKYAAGMITPSFVKSLASITGCMNSRPFLGFQATELLFVGASGSDGSQSETEVTFNFVASQNVTGISIGGISGIDKAGHDYAWEEFQDAVDTGQGVVNAKTVHIERVYDQADFGSVFQWNLYTG